MIAAIDLDDYQFHFHVKSLVLVLFVELCGSSEKRAPGSLVSFSGRFTCCSSIILVGLASYDRREKFMLFLRFGAGFVESRFWSPELGFAGLFLCS